MRRIITSNSILLHSKLELRCQNSWPAMRIWIDCCLLRINTECTKFSLHATFDGFMCTIVVFFLSKGMIVSSSDSKLGMFNAEVLNWRWNLLWNNDLRLLKLQLDLCLNLWRWRWLYLGACNTSKVLPHRISLQLNLLTCTRWNLSHWWINYLSWVRHLLNWSQLNIGILLLILNRRSIFSMVNTWINIQICWNLCNHWQNRVWLSLKFWCNWDWHCLKNW